MDGEAVKAEIQNVINELHERIGRKAARKQYPIAKWQIAKLTELGILDLMPIGFGHSDAGAVITAATSGATAVFNAYGEGEDIPASALHSAIHAADSESEPAPATTEKPAEPEIAPEPAPAASVTPDAATEKQVAYLNDLLFTIRTYFDNRDHQESDRRLWQHAITFVNFIRLPDDLSKEEAGLLISWLKAYSHPVDFMMQFMRNHPRRLRMVGPVAAAYFNTVRAVALAVYQDDFYFDTNGELINIDLADEPFLNRIFSTFERL